MNREQKIAHLEIHGWEPCLYDWWYGLYNAAEKCGFYVCVVGGGVEVRKFTFVVPEGANWGDLRTEVIDMIMSAQETWAPAP